MERGLELSLSQDIISQKVTDVIGFTNRRTDLIQRSLDLTMSISRMNTSDMAWPLLFSCYALLFSVVIPGLGNQKD